MCKQKVFQLMSDDDEKCEWQRVSEVSDNIRTRFTFVFTSYRSVLCATSRANVWAKKNKTHFSAMKKESNNKQATRRKVDDCDCFYLFTLFSLFTTHIFLDFSECSVTCCRRCTAARRRRQWSLNGAHTRRRKKYCTRKLEWKYKARARVTNIISVSLMRTRETWAGNRKWGEGGNYVIEQHCKEQRTARYEFFISLSPVHSGP